jgi:DNA (cytosine-5)-methyltransferase 1
MPLRVVELFAGVGGFRIGLEGPPGSPRNGKYAVVWSNQWEPSTKKQHAAEVYVKKWNLEQSEENPLHYYGDGENFVNEDIAKINAKDIPEHDLLVGGFPCQDYSVAKTAKQAAGIEGKKGVLWWEILRILTAKRPSYAMLENVDRLLKSPTSQRGRDFAVMLASLSELGYIVEWRVINAADYGMPQRRRRVFIMAYAPGTPQYESLKGEQRIKEWIEDEGLFAKSFPIYPLNVLMTIPNQIKGSKDSDLADVSENFNKGANSKSKSPFKKSGILVGNNYYTYDTVPKYKGTMAKLSDVLLNPVKVPIEYIVKPESVMKIKGWKYLKGAKDEPRKGTGDFTYRYKEGPMIFPDALEKPSRTIITGEGGSTPSRFKHVIKFKPTMKMKESIDLETKECQAIRKEFGLTKSEWLRRLTPVELERLNMFPDNHTEGPTDGKRAFFMGNALVTGIIEKLGNYLIVQEESGEFSLNDIQTNEEVCQLYLKELSLGRPFSEVKEKAFRLCPELQTFVVNNIQFFNGLGKRDKGSMGKMVEFFIFGQLPDTDPNPDLLWGADIKVTHFKTNRNGDYNAKERLTITNCGDRNDYSTFNELLVDDLSSCKYYPKIRKGVLFVFEHTGGKYNDLESNMNKKLLSCFSYDLEKMSDEVKEQLSKDFEDIKSKVKAKQISQSGQIYLHTAPHGAGHGSGTRALAFNNKFVTKLVSVFDNKSLTKKGNTWFIEKQYFQ